MKIENIKINAYGNLENKEINLKDKINIIHGANESGKSTLLNFIVSSFYGISKNKDGKELSDYDKYKPWNNEEFSGRIKYKLNNKEYEINVKALERVKIKDLSASEISVRLGSTWIPPEDISLFIEYLLNPSNYACQNINVHYNEATSEWWIEGKN